MGSWLLTSGYHNIWSKQFLDKYRFFPCGYGIPLFQSSMVLTISWAEWDGDKTPIGSKTGLIEDELTIMLPLRVYALGKRKMVQGADRFYKR